MKSKNDEILEQLEPFINDLLEKLATQPKAISKQINLPSQTRAKLTSILRKYPPLTRSQAYKITGATMWTAYNNYLDLVEQINTYFPFQINKITFCNYVAVSNDFFEEILNNDEPEEDSNGELTLKGSIVAMNDDFVNATLSASEESAIDSKAAQLRSKAKKYGHSISETSDLNAIVEDTAKALSQATFVSKLEAAASKRPKIEE